MIVTVWSGVMTYLYGRSVNGSYVIENDATITGANWRQKEKHSGPEDSPSPPCVKIRREVFGQPAKSYAIPLRGQAVNA
jgi:hypothetical protein